MMSAQELSNGISYSGHIYAMTRAGRSLTPTADLYETFTGMDQVSYSISHHVFCMTWVIWQKVYIKRVKLQLLRIIFIFFFFKKLFIYFFINILKNPTYSIISALLNSIRSVCDICLQCNTSSVFSQVRFMKRIAEMPDLTSVLRKLPRIKRHLLNPDNMRCQLSKLHASP